MKKRRDDFQANAKAHAEASEAAWHATKAQLDSEWHGFEAQVKTYFEGVGKQIEQQQGTFRDVAAAQVKTWAEAADASRRSQKLAAAKRRVEVGAKINSCRRGRRGRCCDWRSSNRREIESWTALSAALTELRKAFDRATQRRVGRGQQTAPTSS